MFWLIVIAVVVVVLAASWYYDRHHKIRPDGIPSPHNDRGMGEAKAARFTRDLGGRGPKP